MTTEPPSEAAVQKIEAHIRALLSQYRLNSSEDIDSLAAYLAGIVSTESDLLSDDEKRAAVRDQLQSAVEEFAEEQEAGGNGDSVDTTVEQLMREWDRILNMPLDDDSDDQVNTDDQKNAGEEEVSPEANAQIQAAEALELKRRKKALLERYAYQELEVTVNERGEKQLGLSADQGLPANENAKRVADQEKARRDKLKKAHEEKVARDKASLEKQRLQKEKDKESKKTVKKEKRRM
ncbi:hypothetical protein RI367_003868 [Sorochytrium milnesiophthora]